MWWNDFLVELSNVEVPYVFHGEDCIAISRDADTQMFFIYDRKYNICAYFINNEKRYTIGTEENMTTLLAYTLRYYEKEE